jgi:hypothetical protein
VSITDQRADVRVRAIALIRTIALGGLAAAIAGAVVLGIGGRVAMFVSRHLHPEAVGRITENGNRVGEFTVGGTIEIILFAGVGFGLTAGVIWVLVRQWIPDSAVLVGLGAVAIGGSLLIQSDNTDFVILEGPQIDLLVLVSLVFVFGAAVYWIDGWLNRKMRDRPKTIGVVIYSAMVAAGVVFSYATFATLFSEEFCFCSNPPKWTGVFLIVTALVTTSWWIRYIRGAEEPSKRLNALGTISVALAVSAGAIHLGREILHIL